MLGGVDIGRKIRKFHEFISYFCRVNIESLEKTPSARTMLRTAGRNVVVQLVLKAIQYGLLLVVQILVARILGKDGLGLYSYVSSLALPLWVAVEFGIDNYLIRELAAAPERTHELSAQATSLRLVWGAILLSAAILAGAIALPSATEKICLTLLIVALVPRVITQAYYTVQIARLKYYLSMRLDLYGAALFALCGVIVLPLTHSLVALISCYLAVEVVKMFAALILYKQSVGVPMLHGLRFKKQEMKAVVKTLAPFALVNIFISIHMRLDIILLAAFRGVGEVGVFTAAERFVNASTALPAAVFSGLLPMLAVVAGKGMANRFRGGSLVLFTSVAFVITLFMYFGAPLIIGLTFQFPDSVTVLRILSWSFTLFMFNTVAESVLYGHHLERSVLWVRAVGLVMVILANVWLAPLYGAVGTALATTITEGLLLIMLCGLLMKHHLLKSISTELGT